MGGVNWKYYGCTTEVGGGWGKMKILRLYYRGGGGVFSKKLVFKHKVVLEMDITRTVFLSPSHGVFETPAKGYLAIIFLNKNYNL